MSHCTHHVSLLLQAIESDIGLGHGLPSLHPLLICPRRLHQVAAGVLAKSPRRESSTSPAIRTVLIWFGRSDVIEHVSREFLPDRKNTHWGKRKLKRPMTVLIYVDTSKQVGDPDHLKVFAKPPPRKCGSTKTTRKA